MDNRLREWADRRGYRVAWGPASLLGEVGSDLQHRRQSGELDAGFARENLAFEFGGAARADERVIIVVMPRPAHRVRFVHDGRPIEFLLPPTYQRYRPTFEDVREDLLAHALPGCRADVLKAPLKALAARLGLVRYGRNNLTYASGIGSYLQLVGYLTNAPLPVGAGWHPCEPALLEECDDCRICSAVCPTGAVGEERVLLKAERCLTLAGETPGPWPSHVPPSAHHVLVGCLICQRDCPANPTLPIVDSGVVFGEAETAALVAEGEHAGPTWEAILAHLHALGQPDLEPVLGRNLRACLAAPSARR